MTKLEKFKKGLFKTNKTLKKYLIKTRSEECEECFIKPIWNGLPLNLEVDHIDGDNKNNFPSNLRLLCPNCRSQTVNYKGGNTKFKKAIKKFIIN